MVCVCVCACVRVLAGRQRRDAVVRGAHGPEGSLPVPEGVQGRQAPKHPGATPTEARGRGTGSAEDTAAEGRIARTHKKQGTCLPRWAKTKAGSLANTRAGKPRGGASTATDCPGHLFAPRQTPRPSNRTDARRGPASSQARTSKTSDRRATEQPLASGRCRRSAQNTALTQSTEPSRVLEHVQATARGSADPAGHPPEMRGRAERHSCRAKHVHADGPHQDSEVPHTYRPPQW